MTWPVQLPDELAARQAAAMVAGLGDVDATSPYAPLGAINRAVAGSVFAMLVDQARMAQELLPDTASDWLGRHAAIWGVPREDATVATGNVALTGISGTAVPAGTVLVTLAGLRYIATAAVTLTSGAAVLPVRADVAGAAGNLNVGTRLALQSPIAGLSPQTGTVAAGGISGGADIEDVDTWRARILDRIRNPPRAARPPTISPGQGRSRRRFTLR